MYEFNNNNLKKNTAPYQKYVPIIRVTKIDFRKVEQKFILKGGQSRTEKFEKRDKIVQKSDYFIKCYQRLTSYIFEP